MSAANRLATPPPHGQRQRLEEIKFADIDNPYAHIRKENYVEVGGTIATKSRHVPIPSAEGEQKIAQGPVTPGPRPSKQVEEGDSQIQLYPSFPWKSNVFLAAAFMVLATILLVHGAVTFGGALFDDTRIQKIRMFRHLLNKSRVAAVPLPATFGYAKPAPRQLKGRWIPGDLADATSFHLSVLEVPLTPEVIGDFHDIDDEPVLPVVSSYQSRAEDEDVPSAVKRSILYRAEVPAQVFWGVRGAAELVQKGRLEVLLPDGTLLLQHSFEPIRMEFSEQSDGSSIVTESAVKRLCYALPHDDPPWNGEVVQDCEWRSGLRSPAYVPYLESNKDDRVEIVLRASRDAYVYASETTHGCSSCLGQPYGDSRTGSKLFTCSSREALESTQRCFGAPARWAQAIGLTYMAIAMFLFVLAFGFSALHCRGTVMAASLFAFSILLPAAIAVNFGLPGVSIRSWAMLKKGSFEIGHVLAVACPLLIAMIIPFCFLALIRTVAPQVAGARKRKTS